MGTNLDMDRIAKAMGAERRGKVAARGGYFGALELAAEVAARGFTCQKAAGAHRLSPGSVIAPAELE